MDSSRFEDLLRRLTHSRRSLATSVLVAVSGFLPGPGVEAKKKRKRRKRKPKAKPNAFGCLEVGDPCTSEADCCSGICEGKKGQRKCRAHDTGGCEQDRPGYCEAENPLLALCNGGEALCLRTTAGSNVCANDGVCVDCQRDADCEALGFPPGSACAPLGGDLACADRCEETGMACIYFASITTTEIAR